MSKELRCGDIFPGCEHVVRGDSEQDVMERGARHARSVHGVEEIDEETAERVREAIRDA